MCYFVLFPYYLFLPSRPLKDLKRKIVTHQYWCVKYLTPSMDNKWQRLIPSRESNMNMHCCYITRVNNKSGNIMLWFSQRHLECCCAFLSDNTVPVPNDSETQQNSFLYPVGFFFFTMWLRSPQWLYIIIITLRIICIFIFKKKL